MELFLWDKLFFFRNCFCHVYQMQINWDFFIHIYFAEAVKKLLDMKEKANKEGEVMAWEVKDENVYLGKFVSFHQYKFNEICWRFQNIVEILISINSLEIHFDFFFFPLLLFAMRLCGQTLWKLAILSPLTNKWKKEKKMLLII